jgi:hypothetical protein
MPELNEFPWDKVGSICRYLKAGEDQTEMLTEHIADLKDYETELMERLLLVRSEIDDAEQYLKPKVLTGADITLKGRCKAQMFDWREHYKCDRERALEISQLEAIKTEEIPDVDDQDKYEWYIFHTVRKEGDKIVSNDSKHGRVMYCPRTNIVRSTTMGEFYQGTTVD